MKVEEIPIAFRGAQPEDVWDWFEKSSVRSIGIVNQQTPEVQARVKDAVIESARSFAGADGVTIPSPALLFSATKSAGS